MNNCVGFRNHKHFVLFLFYATIACSYALVLMFSRAIEWIIIATNNPSYEAPIFQVVALTINCVILFPVTIGIAFLFHYQISLVFSNLTTIDEYVRDKEKKEARQEGRTYSWPYDFGWKKNWRLFFGKSVFDWFHVNRPPKGDGTSFEKVESFENGEPRFF